MYSYILMKLFGKSYLKYDGVCLICLIVMAVLCVSPVKVLEAQSFKNESVLNRGSWYKLGVTKDGIYRITYEDLLDMGIQLNTLNPKKYPFTAIIRVCCLKIILKVVMTTCLK